jgi:hypothetical protein
VVAVECNRKAKMGLTARPARRQDIDFAPARRLPLKDVDGPGLMHIAIEIMIVIVLMTARAVMSRVPVFPVVMFMPITTVMPLPVGLTITMIMVAVMWAMLAVIVAKVLMAVLYEVRRIRPDQEKPIG